MADSRARVGGARTEEALLLSDLEAARLLGIGKTKARELLRSGQLASVRIGRRLLVPRRALEDFVSRLEQA